MNGAQVFDTVEVGFSIDSEGTVYLRFVPTDASGGIKLRFRDPGDAVDFLEVLSAELVTVNDGGGGTEYVQREGENYRVRILADGAGAISLYFLTAEDVRLFVDALNGELATLLTDRTFQDG